MRGLIFLSCNSGLLSNLFKKFFALLDSGLLLALELEAERLLGIVHLGGEITSALHDLLVVIGYAVEVLLDDELTTFFSGRDLGGVLGEFLLGAVDGLLLHHLLVVSGHSVKVLPHELHTALLCGSDLLLELN